MFCIEGGSGSQDLLRRGGALPAGGSWLLLWLLLLLPESLKLEGGIRSPAEASIRMAVATHPSSFCESGQPRALFGSNFPDE